MTISARRQRTRTALQEAALVVFARRGVAGASIEEISLKALPFAGASIVAIFIIAYFPQISLWLPSLLGY